MHEKSVKLLNDAIADELSAVHQYMYFHFHCDDQAYDLLANLFRKTSIEEMQHIELLAERILFIGGEVELQANSEVEKMHDVKDMLARAKEMEMSSIQMYNDFANQCAKNADSASKQIFENLVTDEERHYDQFDDESENLKRFGDRYLALQSIERSRAAGGGGGAAE